MRYKKDSIFYIKSLCEKSGARYDIEHERFIPKKEDEVDLMRYEFNRTMRTLARHFLDNGGEEILKKAMDRYHEKREKENFRFRKDYRAYGQRK